MGGRGSCRRTRSLRCSKCYERNLRDYLLGFGTRNWENVEVTGENGNTYTCRCKSCAHTYQTTSAAARREWKWKKNHVNN